MLNMAKEERRKIVSKMQGEDWREGTAKGGEAFQKGSHLTEVSRQKERDPSGKQEKKQKHLGKNEVYNMVTRKDEQGNNHQSADRASKPALCKYSKRNKKEATGEQARHPSWKRTQLMHITEQRVSSTAQQVRVQTKRIQRSSRRRKARALWPNFGSQQLMHMKEQLTQNKQRK
jgi:hypothetical protein